MNIEKAVSELRVRFENDLRDSSSKKDLEDLKIHYLGRKGFVQDLLLILKDLSPEVKPAFGKAVNDLKNFIAEALEERMGLMDQASLEKKLQEETIDITLPGRRTFDGKRHVILGTLDEALDILVGMGFTVQYGPDIDSDYYNFEALNFSKDHPARDMQDTFYIEHEMVLRTHTSNTQVRVMERGRPPLRVVMPGTCYRNEDVSARSHVVFHQIEGMYIDKNVTFSDLLITLEQFFSKFLGQSLDMRYRPSYFPFVEPGVEVDVRCMMCQGKGCPICKKTGWLEVAGAGMIHPEVMKSGGIDSEEYLGYAWGFGIERLVMLRYGIDDIRLFFNNDLRFLQQF